jgi:hypothetical protein
MDLQKMMTVENLLKVLLAIAIGVMLYKVFFGKESYDNYPDLSGYKYPMDYEEDMDLVDAVSEAGDVDDIELVSADSEDEEEEDVDEIEEIEDVVDAEDDIYEYADEENEAYDDSEEIVEDVTEDAKDDDMYMYEEDMELEASEEVDEEIDDEAEEFVVENQEDVDEVKNFDLLYASDVEDGLQESFMLYSNLVGVDTNYA